jgi:hypothetical protein
VEKEEHERDSGEQMAVIAGVIECTAIVAGSGASWDGRGSETASVIEVA